MSRTLGSFNQRQLDRHPSDHQVRSSGVSNSKPKARGGYMLGLYTEKYPVQHRHDNAEKFFYGRQPKERRMAGDILNLDLTQSPGTPASLPLPKMGSAELRTPELPQ